VPLSRVQSGVVTATVTTATVIRGGIGKLLPLIDPETDARAGRSLLIEIILCGVRSRLDHARL
jgi:hypothetical protein